TRTGDHYFLRHGMTPSYTFIGLLNRPNYFPGELGRSAACQKGAEGLPPVAHRREKKNQRKY
ncbi:MAG: hypothetical protein ACTH6H_17920, partial [Serratia sp. (in: enterobacteria)]